jgi:hypothetical protein
MSRSTVMSQSQSNRRPAPRANEVDFVEVEVREPRSDEYSQRLSTLEADNRRLQRELERVTQLNRRLTSQQQDQPIRPYRLRFVAARIDFRPTPAALRGMYDLYASGQYGAYLNRLTHALGQVAVADDASVRSLYTHILAFFEGSRSLAGLESLFLSCMHNTWLTRDESLYRAGISAWQSYQPRAPRSRKTPGLVFYDRETNLVSFVSAAACTRLHRDLLEGGFFADGGIGGAVRTGAGLADDNPYGWSVSRCGLVVAALATAGGGVAGAIGAGLAAGPGAAVAGGKEGLELGAALGVILAGAICHDDKPAAQAQTPGTTEQPDTVETPDMSVDVPDAGRQDGAPQPTDNENEQQMSMPDEHPDQSCDGCVSVMSSGYPLPDGPDGPGGPLASIVEIVSFPTENGEPGGPAGLAGVGSKTFLVHGMPRLAAGNQSLARAGFLPSAGTASLGR